MKRYHKHVCHVAKWNTGLWILEPGSGGFLPKIGNRKQRSEKFLRKGNYPINAIIEFYLWKRTCCLKEIKDGYNVNQEDWEKQKGETPSTVSEPFENLEKVPRSTLLKRPKSERISTGFLFSTGEAVPVVLSSINMSKAILPTGPASAGERSCWGTGALLKVSSMTVLWSAEPEMRTLSRAQSFWSRPSCLGCHQRKRVAICLASGGRRIFTNLQDSDGETLVRCLRRVKDLQPETWYYESVFACWQGGSCTSGGNDLIIW